MQHNTAVKVSEATGTKFPAQKMKWGWGGGAWEADKEGWGAQQLHLLPSQQSTQEMLIKALQSALQHHTSDIDRPACCSQNSRTSDRMATGTD